MSMKKLALCLAMFAAPAMATEQMQAFHVEELVSLPGQSLPSFLADVGRHLRAFSDATSFEACGMLSKGGDRYGVTLYTNHSHIGCLVDESVRPNGMRSMGETIHSHGIDEPIMANREDKAMLGIDDHRQIHVSGQHTDMFSETDFMFPGYLATKTGIIHQDGKRHVTHIIDYKDTP